MGYYKNLAIELEMDGLDFTDYWEHQETDYDNHQETEDPDSTPLTGFAFILP